MQRLDKRLKARALPDAPPDQIVFVCGHCKADLERKHNFLPSLVKIDEMEQERGVWLMPSELHKEMDLLRQRYASLKRAILQVPSPGLPTDLGSKVFLYFLFD